jgi:Ribbon-helix-helix protein, copG family
MITTKSTAKQAKKPRGRPPTGHDPQYAVRLPKQVIAAVDKIAKETQSTRAGVMRQLITEALETRKRL